MSNAYFLLAGEIRFYFESPNLSLHYHEKHVRLPPKEAQTLKFALDNRDRIIKPDDIAEHLWGKEAVEADYTNKKSQAITQISKLRRKMEQLGYKKIWLTTYENQGYRLICAVEVITDEVVKQQEISRKIKHKHRQKLFEALKYSSSSVLVTLCVIFAIYWWLSDSDISVVNVSQLPPLSGVSVEPHFSPSGDAIAFSYESREYISKIYLKLDDDINYRILTNHYFDQAPIFSPFANQLAYHRKIKNGSKKLCEIRVITFGQDYEFNGDDRKVADCSTLITLSSIAWYSEKELLFTDKVDIDSPIQVYLYNIETKQRRLFMGIEDPENFGPGIYHIKYDHNKKRLLALDAYQWQGTLVHEKIGDNATRPVTMIKQIVKSIAVMNDHIVYKGMGNQLKRLSLLKNGPAKTIYHHPLSPISYPNIDAAGEQIAFVTGMYSKSSIYRYDLSNKNHAEVISSQSKLLLPKAADKELLVISEETGIKQIYAYTKAGRSQLSNFTTNHNIINFVSDVNKRWLAVNFPDKTVLYARDTAGLTEVKHFELMVYPQFSPQGNRLLLSEQVDSTVYETDVINRLVEFDLSEFDNSGNIPPTGVSVNDAIFGVYYDKGIIFTYSNAQGISYFAVGENRPINTSVNPVSPDGFAVGEDYVYLLNDKTEFVRIHIETGETEILPSELYGDFSIYDNAIYYLDQDMGNMDIVVGDLQKSKFVIPN